MKRMALLSSQNSNFHNSDLQITMVVSSFIHNCIYSVIKLVYISHADRPENFKVTIGYIDIHSNYSLTLVVNESYIYPGS